LEARVHLGVGDECWSACRDAVMGWAVKTRSGFSVIGGASQAVIGGDYELLFRCGPLAVREPVQVVRVVDHPDRRGFAYGTRFGHPVSGEEAFVVERDPAGSVWLIVRSLTLPAPGWRGLVFPVFWVAQRLLRSRYLRALVCR
jgi:uncharacterized protein (UPF0548 family)